MGETERPLCVPEAVFSFRGGTSAALECPTETITSSAAHFFQERHSMLQPPVCRDADLTLSIKKDAISRISLRQPSRSRRKNVMKTRGRPFQKGNPGRPKGARDTATLAVERLLEGER